MKRKIGFCLSVLVLSVGSLWGVSASADTAICADGSHLSSGICVSDTVSVSPLTVTSSEACPSALPGQTATLNSSTHQCAMSAVSVPATVGTTYTCPSGGLLGGTSGAWGSGTTTCYVNAVVLNAIGTTGYSCPGGGVPTASGTPGVFDTCVTDSTASSYQNTNIIVGYTCASGRPLLVSGVHKCVTVEAILTSAPTVVTTTVCPVNTSLSVDGTVCQSFGITSYPSTPVPIYVCPSGGVRSGNLCIIGAYASIYNATQVGVNYTCPSGGSPSSDLVQLCQTTGVSTSIPPSYNLAHSCASGTLSPDSLSCIGTPATMVNAAASTSYGNCASPAVNADPYCVTYSHVVNAAYYSTTYSCPSGTPSGSGYSMLCTISAASSYGATLSGIVDSSTFSGGSISNDGTYFYRTFTTSGTLGGITGSSPSVAELVLGAGGSGGGSSGGISSGGGGGQLVVNTGVTLTGSSQTVTVGTPTASADQTQGGSSVFNGVTAIGGYTAGNGYGNGGASGGNTGHGGNAWSSGGTHDVGETGNASYASWAPVSAIISGGYLGSGGGSQYTGTVYGAGPGAGTASAGGSGNSATANTGSGGGGGGGGYWGGNGASGLVIVRWVGSANYYCPLGTSSGSGSSTVCITTAASVVASVYTYSGTCATDFTMNTVTGFCDSVSVSLGVPLVPTGSYYCMTVSSQVPIPFYSIMSYNGSTSNNDATRTCSLLPPVGFVIAAPQVSGSSDVAYICEEYKVDSNTGIGSVFDYVSSADRSGTGSGGVGYISCDLLVTDNVDASSATDTSSSTDGSGDSSGYIMSPSTCFSSYPTDIVALNNCLNQE